MQRLSEAIDTEFMKHSSVRWPPLSQLISEVLDRVRVEMNSPQQMARTRQAFAAPTMGCTETSAGQMGSQSFSVSEVNPH